MSSPKASSSFPTSDAAPEPPPLAKESPIDPLHHEEQPYRKDGGLVSPSQDGVTFAVVDLPLSLHHPPLSDDGTKDGASSPSMSSTSRTTSSSAPFLSIAEQTFTPVSMELDVESVGDLECDAVDAPRCGNDSAMQDTDLTVTSCWRPVGQDQTQKMSASQLLTTGRATAAAEVLQPHPTNRRAEDSETKERSEPQPSMNQKSASDESTTRSTGDDYFSLPRESNGSSETLLAKSAGCEEMKFEAKNKNIPARYRRERPTVATTSEAREMSPLTRQKCAVATSIRPVQPPAGQQTQSVRGIINPGVSGTAEQHEQGNTNKISPVSPSEIGQDNANDANTRLCGNFNHDNNAVFLHDASPASQTSSSPASSIVSYLQQQLLLEERHADEPPNAADGGSRTQRSQPLVRTTSDNLKLDIRHPAPDINLNTDSLLGNIAQLEATAERLSMTSSIEEAIRDLHTELKRSDSQRSSILAARVRSQSNPDSEAENDSTGPVATALSRQLSAASSIISLNSAARQGGYSPGGYNISPSHSIRNRLMPTSQNGAGRFDMEFESYLSRHGPGKGSVRSIRLAEIAETEPSSLTQDVLDEADRTDLTEEDDDTIKQITTLTYDDHLDDNTDDMLTPNSQRHPPNTDAFHALLEGTLEQPSPDLRLGEPSPSENPHAQYPDRDHEPRPRASMSTMASSEQARNAFHDFDGVHCEPDFMAPPIPPPPQPEESMPPSMSPPSTTYQGPRSPPLTRPKSYLNPETGQQMLYYPARVPMMLNLPPKLSKKPKAKEFNERRSKVLSTMPQAAKEPAPWLPDPLEGHAQSPFSPDPSSEESPFTSNLVSPKTDSPVPSPGLPPEIKITDPTETTAPPGDAQTVPVGPDDDVQPAVPRVRNSRMIDAENRKSQMARYSNLPPQLRASVYFDLGNTTPELQVKDGSAMATLDSLLDASANAPVSAFTDHLIAGKLGSEVYGIEKKRKSKLALEKEPDRPQSSHSVGGSKKRSGFFLRNKKSAELLDDDRHNTIKSVSHVGVVGVGAKHGDEGPLPEGAVGYGTLHPDTDEVEYVEAQMRDGEEQEEDEEEGESEEDGEEYHGPPTTLLAELQIRKQQQKNRTRNFRQQFPNGMHTTLLELDAVAETQRVSRKGKKVNLAWEEPPPFGQGDESEDEDVPLGVLYAAKATGAKDLESAVADLNRPLGLMERREMEDNEPLSFRRARLQNQDPRNTVVTKRDTIMLHASAVMSGARLSQMPAVSNLNVASEDADEDEDEVEGETMAERLRRLKAKEEEELPRARPVSAAFSAELLDAFVDPEEERKKEEENAKVAAAAAQSASPAAEEEETLGQRRRRLQAEKEARDRELGYGGAVPRPNAISRPSAMSHRLSMADILAAHPQRETSREELERRQQEEDARYLREQDQKMAAMRMQMPTTLRTPSFNNNMGGFHNGAFNDGMGGVAVRSRSPGPNNVLDVPTNPMLDPFSNPRVSTAFSSTGLIQQAGTPLMRNPYGAQNYNGAAIPGAPAGGQMGGYFGGGGMPMQMGMGMPMMGMQTVSPMQMSMQQQQQQQQQPQMQVQMPGMGMPVQMGGAGAPMGMGMGIPQGQPPDMIDRWRQSVVP